MTLTPKQNPYHIHCTEETNCRSNPGTVARLWPDTPAPRGRGIQMIGALYYLLNVIYFLHTSFISMKICVVFIDIVMMTLLVPTESVRPEFFY